MARNFRSLWFPLALLAAGAWLAFALLGGMIARVIAARFEGALSRAADGKFDDPAAFVHGRLAECLLLASAAIGLAGVCVLLWNRLGRRTEWRPYRGLLTGVLGFALLNVFIWSAGQTVLFWSLFYDSVRIDNFAQYHIKRVLMDETRSKRRAILLGSSQTNRSIDEVLLNQQIGGTIWTTELTQPGARGFDLLTLSRDIPLKRGDLVICYLSEIMFYGSGSGIVAADFMSFREVPDAIELKGWSHFPEGAARSGLLGRALPLYRYRNSLAHRTLGWDICHLEQRKFDQSLESELEAQAKRRAPRLGFGDASRFEEAAFSRMADELAAKGCTLLVISGDTHPALRRHMNPGVIDHLHGFLEGLRAKHPDQVLLLEGNRFFQPAESDFTDLVHFNDDAQRRFTTALGHYLEQLPANKALRN